MVVAEAGGGLTEVAEAAGGPVEVAEATGEPVEVGGSSRGVNRVLQDRASTGNNQSARLQLQVQPEGSSKQVGVMRPRSGVKEYDLIPAVPQGATAAQREPPGPKTVLPRRSVCPLTSKLSRKMRKNFHDHQRATYVPCCTRADVRAIGDKSKSFNVHCNKNQVRPTSLRASSQQNREIERLITKQRRMTLDDWRDHGGTAGRVDCSGIWADTREHMPSARTEHRQSDGRNGAFRPWQNNSREGTSARPCPWPWPGEGRMEVFSTRTRPRPRRNDWNRVEVFSNYCRHCGGRK